MFVDRPVAIVRAGGVEAAGVGRQSAGEGKLVQADRRQEQETRQVPYAYRQIPQARFGWVFMIKMEFRRHKGLSKGELASRGLSGLPGSGGKKLQAIYRERG